MEFYYYSPKTFVVLTADQFVARDDGLLEQLRQDIHVSVCRKNCTQNSSYPTQPHSIIAKYNCCGVVVHR